MFDNNEFLKPKPDCPILDVDGFMSNGRQFDIDITLPQDNRNVIYGTIRNTCKEPVKDAVVKLVEIVIGKDGMKKRIPISHTFTDEYGEFVFGPLCADKVYAIDIWVNDVRNCKISAICHREGKCLKGKTIEFGGCINQEHQMCKCEKNDEKCEPQKPERPEHDCCQPKKMYR